MSLDEFVAAFANLFDDTDESEFFPECEFHELDEWSSLSALGVIAMVKIEFGKTLTGAEINNCETIKDVYELVGAK